MNYVNVEEQTIQNPINLIQKVLPDFELSQIEEPLNTIGIDSIDLVAIRVEFEKYLGENISDIDWVEFNSFSDMISYYETIKDSQNKIIKERDKLNLVINKVIKLNMPQMANAGISENWLFKELGSLHWELLCKGLGTNSDEITDELGNRLYATFVRIRIQSSSSVRDFSENETINIRGKISRYGNGMYFSNFRIDSDDNFDNNFTANLMTSFSKRNSNGNKTLVKSQPFVATNYVNKLQELPDFGNEYRLIKKGELSQIKMGTSIFNIEENVLFETEYTLNSYYDLNGVGLLYFAAYPIINDYCEAEYFNKKKSGLKRWEQTSFTASKDILYYSNCDIDDMIIYKLHNYEEQENIIKITSSLTRKSDNKKMARIFSIKKKKN